MSADARDGLRTVAVMVAAFVSTVLLLALTDFAWPHDGTGIEASRLLSSIRQWLHSLATVCLGVASVAAIDMALLPWFQVHEAVRGEGEWQGRPVAVRCTAIGGWFLLAASVLLSVTQGVIAL